MGAEDLNSLHSLLNAKWRRLKWAGILNPSMLRSKIPTTVLYDVLLLRRHLPFDRGRLTGVTSYELRFRCGSFRDGVWSQNYK